MYPLKLNAFDENDLLIISSHLQNASLGIEDIAWLKGENRFAFLCTRHIYPYDEKGERGEDKICRTGLYFEHVKRVEKYGINQKEHSLTLLSILFYPTDPPSGDIMIMCENNKKIRLNVECIEAALSDLGCEKIQNAEI